jgi:hypothetical protein
LKGKKERTERRNEGGKGKKKKEKNTEDQIHTVKDTEVKIL